MMKKLLYSAFLLLVMTACISTLQHNRKNALDTLTMCEYSPEAGVVIFKHRHHYASAENGGQGIGCIICHHDYEGPDSPLPGACRNCHPTHHDKNGKAKSPL